MESKLTASLSQEWKVALCSLGYLERGAHSLQGTGHRGVFTGDEDDLESPQLLNDGSEAK